MIDSNSGTLLLVEDENLIAAGIKKILEKNGYSVLTAASGKEAFKILDEHPTSIDLILMDITLKNGIDGIQAAELIQKKKRTPIVFLSSHTEPEILDKASEISSYGYILKNSGETVMLASIRMAMNLYDANRRIDDQKQELQAANTELQEALKEVEEAADEILLSGNELRASEERNRALLDAIPDLMFLFDKDGFFIDYKTDNINQLIAAPETFLNKHVSEVLPGNLAQFIMNHINHVYKYKQPQIFEYQYEINNDLKQFEARLVPCGEDKSLSIIREVTERKRSEETLKKSGERARKQRAAIAELALDEAVTAGEIDDALKKITTVLTETLDAERASVWTLSEDNSQLTCLCLYESDTKQHSEGAVLNAKEIPNYFEAILKESRIYAEDAQSDPRTRELADTYLIPRGITSMLDAGIITEGKLDGVICLEHTGEPRKWNPDEEAFASTAASIVAQVFTNIKRREAEKDREKMQNQLFQAQKMDSIGRLAGGVAHDFNNMLGVILGHTEILIKETDPDQPFYSDLAEIRKAAERSVSLTRQLLAFARKQTTTPEVLDINKTIEGMLKMLHRLIGENIKLEWIPENDIRPVKIDPGQVDQILANLCVNARDAISENGKITIETKNVTLDENYSKDRPGFIPGEYVMLAVSDNGCGMDKETLSHLFEPFFTTKEVGEGAGLGLSTIYGILKQNNSFINTYSEPGQGTTFKIYLPRYTGETEQKKIRPESESSQVGHETILLVEDEPAILNITRKMLESFGYSIIAAPTPAEALHLAKENTGKIHLLMTDVIMPGMNGRELADKINSLYPEIKCLFMSGYTADVIVQHNVLDDDVHFIQKPFSIKDLALKIREALKKT